MERRPVPTMEGKVRRTENQLRLRPQGGPGLAGNGVFRTRTLRPKPEFRGMTCALHFTLKMQGWERRLGKQDGKKFIDLVTTAQP